MARTLKSSTPRRTRHPKSTFKLPSRSPLPFRRRSADLSRGTVPRPSNARFGPRFLTTIREESPVVRRHPRDTRSLAEHRDFHLNDDTLYDGPDGANLSNVGDASDSEDLDFPWEEESTLFDDLMDEDPKASSDDKIESLANSLQESFDLEGKQIKKEICKALVPAVNRVKTLYSVLDEKVDTAFGKGLLTFNKACKDAEAMAIQEQDDMKSIYMASQAKIKELSGQLEQAYTHRAQLWVDFERALDEIVEPTLETLKDIPAKIERRLTNFDKKAKDLDKDDGETASATRKKLKALLSKLS